MIPCISASSRNEHQDPFNLIASCVILPANTSVSADGKSFYIINVQLSPIAIVAGHPHLNKNSTAQNPTYVALKTALISLLRVWSGVHYQNNFDPPLRA